MIVAKLPPFKGRLFSECCLLKSSGSKDFDLLLNQNDLLPVDALDLGQSSFLRETDMRKSRFTEEHFIKVLKEHAAGLSAGDVCRKHGLSEGGALRPRADRRSSFRRSNPVQLRQICTGQIQ